jgi:hypothetical protein
MVTFLVILGTLYGLYTIGVFFWNFRMYHVGYRLMLREDPRIEELIYDYTLCPRNINPFTMFKTYRKYGREEWK